MKIRGQRECQSCGTRWSYYDTGSVACPNCGDLRSVGVDDRTRHTATPTDLDLSAHRTALADGEIPDVADGVKSDCRAYVRERGFIHGGDLLPLDDTVLSASELVHAVDLYARLRDPTDDEQLYVLDLLRGADQNERPPADEVPESLAEGRGLGYAESIDDYRREVVTWLDDNPDPAARRTLGTVGEQVRRIEALQGDVPPATVETLVAATREVVRYLTESDETALASAQDRLARLD
jgi:predicted RNA-binding Zn-ribbon protein involved in translation (DUF1610 family)